MVLIFFSFFCQKKIKAFFVIFQAYIAHFIKVVLKKKLRKIKRGYVVLKLGSGSYLQKSPKIGQNTEGMWFLRKIDFERVFCLRTMVLI